MTTTEHVAGTRPSFDYRAARLAGLKSLSEANGGRTIAEARPAPRRARHGAVLFMPGQHQRRLDRNERARVWQRAVALERRTKPPGRRGGVLMPSGLAVLQALLFGFLNARDGRCDPSYDAIQSRTGLCRQAIADALARLEAAGVVTIVRRMVRKVASVACRITGGEARCTVLRQTSNAYLFGPPVALHGVTAGPGDPRPFPARRQASLLAWLLGAESTRQGQTQSKDKLGLENRPERPCAGHPQKGFAMQSLAEGA